MICWIVGYKCSILTIFCVPIENKVAHSDQLDFEYNVLHLITDLIHIFFYQ